MLNTSNIREHMEVVGSCGMKVGLVDEIEASSIKLTRDGPDGDGEHHYVPLAWVARVDDRVYLTKACDEVRREWQAAPIGAGTG